MTSDPFPSQAAHHEDVVLWRALGHLTGGRGLELAADPEPAASVLGGLEQRGWSVLRAASAPSALDAAASAGWKGDDLHVLVVGARIQVGSTVGQLADGGLVPWVILVAATPIAGSADGTDLLTSAGYERKSFDGANTTFVHRDHAELAERLSYPAGSRDHFTTGPMRELIAANQALSEQLAAATRSAESWRAAAVQRWDEIAAEARQRGDADGAEAMRQTLSWRVTRPLRAARRLIPGADA